MKFNNFDITKIYYSGHTISKVYGCGGDVVFQNYKLRMLYRVAPREYTLTFMESSGTTLTSGDTRPSGYTPRNAVSAEIGYGVEEIGDAAFSGITNLSAITIPSTVHTIGNQAFAGMDGMYTASTFVGNEGIWDLRNVKHFGEYIVSRTNAGNSNHFQYILMRDVETAKAAFPFCSFRSNDYGFVIDNPTPPTGTGNMFPATYAPYSVWVPDDAVDVYKANSRFRTYADKIKPISELPITLT